MTSPRDKGKSPERSIAFPKKYYFWVLTGLQERRTLFLGKKQARLDVPTDEPTLHSLFPLAPRKLLRQLGRKRILVHKSRQLRWSTKNILARYPFRVRCGGGCRFNVGPAICFPFKRLCWGKVSRRFAFYNPAQGSFADLQEVGWLFDPVQ